MCGIVADGSRAETVLSCDDMLHELGQPNLPYLK